MSVHLFHLLDSLRQPLENGDAPTFSCKFIPKQGERKGKLLHIEKAQINHISEAKTKEKATNSGSKTKMKYFPDDHDLIALRVLESKDIKEPVITVNKYLIVEINSQKTFI